MILLYKDCDLEQAKSKELPRNSYIVSYVNNEKICHDIIQSSSQVEVFNSYWDEYRSVLSITWTMGLIDPKSYGYVPKDIKKKK